MPFRNPFSLHRRLALKENEKLNEVGLNQEEVARLQEQIARATRLQEELARQQEELARQATRHQEEATHLQEELARRLGQLEGNSFEKPNVTDNNSALSILEYSDIAVNVLFTS
jgi:FtsZ-binding cell division protein ZapB